MLYGGVNERKFSKTNAVYATRKVLVSETSEFVRECEKLKEECNNRQSKRLKCKLCLAHIKIRKYRWCFFNKGYY